MDPFNFDAAYIAQVASDVAYAHAHNIIVGYYVLLQNPPGMNGGNEVIDPANGQPEGIACFVR